MASSLAPDFVLRLVDGRGLLGLRAPLPLPLGRLERLDLEVPNLRFPFDGSGDPSRFRNRRCTVRDAAVRIDEEQLTSWLASQPLERYGIDDLRARVAGDRLQIAGALTVGADRAPFTLALRLRAGAPPATLTVQIVDLRTYDALPAPAPLVGLALLYALGARPPSAPGLDGGPPSFVLRGIDVMELDAFSVVLWRALLPFGWRLPRTDAKEQPRLEIDGRGLVLAFTGGSTGETDRAADTERASIAAGDERLAMNDLVGALRIYEGVDSAAALRRRLATLAALPGRGEDARVLGEALLAEAPDDVGVLVALAGVLSRPEPERASELYQQAAVRAERAGEPDAAIEAALRGAELLLPGRADAAIPLLERVVSGRSGHTRAASLLAECYTAQGRNANLLRLEKRRLSNARGQREEAQARVRLGAIWLDSRERSAARPRRARARVAPLPRRRADLPALRARPRALRRDRPCHRGRRAGARRRRRRSRRRPGAARRSLARRAPRRAGRAGRGRPSPRRRSARGPPRRR